MRTTITIDDDLLRAAQSMARARSASVGTIVSELMRSALCQDAVTVRTDGFPVFDVRPDAPPITLDDVKKLEDEA